MGQLGDTPMFCRLMEMYENGGVSACTSAGAAAMCATMLVKGAGSELGQGRYH